MIKIKYVDLQGRSNGKSTLANMIAKKMYQPHRHVTKVNAPAASANLTAIAAWPCARWRYEPARRPKAGTRVKKIKKKIRFVRMEQIR